MKVNFLLQPFTQCHKVCQGARSWNFCCWCSSIQFRATGSNHWL